jgi:hypothetical protein
MPNPNLAEHGKATRWQPGVSANPKGRPSGSPPANIVLGKAPEPSEGYEIVRIDVVVRLRRKTITLRRRIKKRGAAFERPFLI